jgi:hypothetical protein
MPLLHRGIMGATSVTGKGQGDSNGKQKPDNHCGCGCPGPEEEERERVKLGCVTKITVNNRASYTASNGKASIKVC